MKKKQIIIGLIISVALLACIKSTYMYYEYKQEEKRLSETPYYTEYKLTRYEYSVMARNYYVDENPSLRDVNEEDRMRDWPDFSYYTMQASEETEIVVTVLNYYLFDEQLERDQAGWKKAEEYGFSSENRITIDWVMSHPKEAVDIMYNMWDHGYIFNDYQWIKKKYNEINEASIVEATEQMDESTEQD